MLSTDKPDGYRLTSSGRAVLIAAPSRAARDGCELESPVGKVLSFDRIEGGREKARRCPSRAASNAASKSSAEGGAE
jgi:hypothetical protein